MPVLPCLIFEDDHLLVINKPAGLNTHSPAPHAGEGLYEWLRHREARWASLAIIHRLDKDTSGVIVFGKNAVANRSLTAQFADRTVHKQYVLLTDRPIPSGAVTVKSSLVRAGDKYLSRAPDAKTGAAAETRFQPGHLPAPPGLAGVQALEAQPLTGRTHQIRVHAADKGFPILGDSLYGGTLAARLYLHAAELAFAHPVTGEQLTFRAPPCFADEPHLALRKALIDSEQTNAFRLVHGAADGWPGWYVDRLGEFLLSHSEAVPASAERAMLEKLRREFSSRGIYHKTLLRRVRQTRGSESCPQAVAGASAPALLEIRENGLRFALSFNEGYSTGLFLDQRDNRRKLLTGYIAPGFQLPTSGAEVLNTFAYTCGFSLCAAKAGYQTTSVDLSKKYLDWGRRNFALNGLDAGGHQFIFGDTFDWAKRFEKKNRLFDIIVLDPPTFSQSRHSGVFRVEKDLTRLIEAALRILKPKGIIFVSSNAAGWASADFLAAIELAVRAARRQILQMHYQPQPPDFPITRAEPGYLKSAWVSIGS